MKTNNLESLITLLKRKKDYLAAHYKVKEIGIFGSYARGDNNPYSDLDILVQYRDNSIDIFDFLELKEYLAELLGKEVDLVTKEGLKPNIGKKVLSQVKYA